MPKRVVPVETCPDSGRKFKRRKNGCRYFLCEHERAPTRCKKGECATRYKNRGNEKCPCGSGVTLNNCRKCDTPGAGSKYCPKTKVARPRCKCDDPRCGGSRCEHGKERRVCPTCDPIGYTCKLVRDRTRHALKSAGIKKSKRTCEYLGCRMDHYHEYLESTFQSGMTWENLGTDWEIGHRKPLREKGISDEETLARLNWKNTFAQW